MTTPNHSSFRHILFNLSSGLNSLFRLIAVWSFFAILDGSLMGQGPDLASDLQNSALQNSDLQTSDDATPNMKMATLGGKQFWTDHVWFYDWRIQKNALTGHFRLLDPSNVRHAWGTREHCIRELDRLRLSEQNDAPERVVILLHGLMRTSGSMASLGKYLQEKTLARPVLVEYASTQGSVGEHAAALRGLIEGLPARPNSRGPRIDFVAHSMGNIVIRKAIGDWQRGPDTYECLPRMGKMVMLGPPNQGAMIAKRLSRTGIFGLVTGKGGLELGKDWSVLEPGLAIPPIPFAVIAGNLENNTIQNPLVEGASDFVVRVEEAKLEGMADFMEVPILHSFLMEDPSVQQAVSRFLDTGHLQPPP